MQAECQPLNPSADLLCGLWTDLSVLPLGKALWLDQELGNEAHGSYLLFSRELVVFQASPG